MVGPQPQDITVGGGATLFMLNLRYAGRPTGYGAGGTILIYVHNC